MKGDINMSQKETFRVSIIEKLMQKSIKVSQAARELNLSVRQVKRLNKRYRKHGVKGLVHAGRGKESNHKIAREEIDRAIGIVRERYWDFNPLLALEKLREFHGVRFGKETLRKAMIEAGLWQPKRQRVLVIHQRRPRRACLGELVQADGSDHLWFEDRGPRCTLLVFVDDATGKLLHLEFCESESLWAYFKAVKAYFLKHGKPLCFYVDKHGVFRVNSKRNGFSAIEDNTGITQFARAMQELGVELIFAHSAQAKGRVEKINATLQNRLVKELRLKGISTLKEANKYLPEFTVFFNAKFAVPPKKKNNCHRPLTRKDKLEEILVIKKQRILSKNLEVQFQNKVYQIQTPRPRYAMRKRPVVVTQNLEGRVRIYFQGKQLNYRILEEKTNKDIIDTKSLNTKVDQVKKEKWIPAQDHPWRKGPFLFG